MEDNEGAFYISDGEILSSKYQDSPDIIQNRVVYEVIRIIDNVPLFLEDHFERLVNSFKAIGGLLRIEPTELRSAIKRLLAANGSSCCNVKLTVYEASDKQKFTVYISKSYYPDQEQISNGVPVGLLKLERQNPNAKVLNSSYREAVAESMRKDSFFEVLLVNRDNRITEGSKSNVFFYKDGRVFTAPGSEVLKGITRKYVIQACGAAGFEASEELVGVDGMDSIEGLFLSGTSIKVLPISRVEELKFDSAVHPAIISIRDEYDKLVRKYIEENVKMW